MRSYSCCHKSWKNTKQSTTKMGSSIESPCYVDFGTVQSLRTGEKDPKCNQHKSYNPTPKGMLPEREPGRTNASNGCCWRWAVVRDSWWNTSEIVLLSCSSSCLSVPVCRHCALHHCRWLQCHCSSFLFFLSRLQGSAFNPVPIFLIVFCVSGGMQHKVVSTRQCHILVATHKTCCHQSQCCDVIADVLSNAGIILLMGPTQVITCNDQRPGQQHLGLTTCQTTNLGWSWLCSWWGVMWQRLI